MAVIPSFFRVRRVEETCNTNADVKQAAEAGEPEGFVVQAVRQTAGKGRLGRTWESPEGNLYMSVLLRPRCSPQEAGLYSFVGALAVYEAVGAFLPEAEIELKWPNDVLVGGKKISGVLLEAAAADKNVVDWLVMGVGINARHYPENGLCPATSLAAEGAAARVSDILEKLLASLDHWRQVLTFHGFLPVRQAWLDRAITGQVEARLPHETIRGEFADLDDLGALVLRLPDGTERAISAGDVFFG